jgi:hypothetical protein
MEKDEFEVVYTYINRTIQPIDDYPMKFQYTGDEFTYHTKHKRFNNMTDHCQNTQKQFC